VTTYSVDLDRVAEIAQEMNNIAAQIQSTLEELEAQNSASLANWASWASEGYAEAKRQWDQKASDMVGQAAAAHAALTAIHENYTLAEQHGRHVWGR
jgi:WXG100 family type VII secretion target